MDAVIDQSELTRSVHRDRADGVRFELATPADDAEVRRLLRENPMPGRVSISLEREPDARLAAEVEGDVHHTVVARDSASGRLMGLGSISVRDVYLNGEVTRAGYLGQLRLDRRYRGRASIVVGGYRLFRELHETLGATLYLTSVATDNLRAKRFLERSLPDMPYYRQLEPFVTSVIEPRKTRLASNVTRARPDHLPDILECLRRNGRRFQFTPVWRTLASRGLTVEDFVIATRGGRVVGCAAGWNQSSFKQAVVRGYEPRLARWLPIINLAGRFLGVPRLPRVGEPLDFVYVSHLAVDNDDPDVFAALLAGVAASRKGRRLGLGLSARHPLSNAFPRTVKRRTYTTDLYAVHWDDGRAAADGLNRERICQPEVALL